MTYHRLRVNSPINSSPEPILINERKWFYQKFSYKRANGFNQNTTQEDTERRQDQVGAKPTGLIDFVDLQNRIPQEMDHQRIFMNQIDT